MAARFAPWIDPEPGALVERFSFEIETRQHADGDTEEYEQLRLDFIAERERRNRQRQQDTGYSGTNSRARTSDDAAILERAKHQLLQSMKHFQGLVPNHSKSSEVPASWDDVWSVAIDVQTRWESKKKESHVSRAKEWVRKMCNGMNNHATALKMLPSESEYVSLIAGSVSMIIKASANHINISESFARGVVDINDAVNLEHLSHVYDTTVFQELTMRLYTQIFTYLIKFMTWFTAQSRTRFLKSFNENSHRLFEDDLAQVKKTSALLSTQIQLHMSADVKGSKTLIEDMSGEIFYLRKFSEARERQARLRDAANTELIQSLLRHQFQKTKEEVQNCLEDMKKNFDENLRSAISGGGITNILHQQASDDSRNVSRALVAHIRTNPVGVSASKRSPRENDDNLLDFPQESDVRFDSRHLEDYFEWDHVHPAIGHPLPLLAEASFVGRLSSFTTALKSQILYAHGQYQVEASSLLRQSASAYVSLARDAGAPVISYFCKLSHNEPPANRTRESVELSALLNAVIRQLVNILPSDAASTTSFPEVTRFVALDGTLRTWREAISMIRDLVRCVNLQLLLFVIDGINVLEDDSELVTTEPLQNLARLLNDLAKPSALGDDIIVKVLFTSSGPSNTLCQVLDEDDMIICDNSSSVGSGGFRRARQVMFY